MGMPLTLRRSERMLMVPDGVAEAVGMGLYMVAASVGLTVSGGLPSWTSLAAGIVLAWALLLAPVRSWLSTGAVVCVIIALLPGNIEWTALIMVSLILVVEVQWANAEWRAGAASVVAILAGCVLLAPETVWGVSPLGAWLLVIMGITCALVVALIRRQLILVSAVQQAAVELGVARARSRLSRRLHDSVADSLTRIVLLTHQPEPDVPSINREARQGVSSLRDIMAVLEGHVHSGDVLEEELVPFDDLIAEGVASLRSVGLQVGVTHGTWGRIVVGEEVAECVREMFRNVMKHGQSPVRVLTEGGDGMGRILMANEVPVGRSKSGDEGAAGGVGLGLPIIESHASAIGGRFSHRVTGKTASAVLEFPCSRMETE